MKKLGSLCLAGLCLLAAPAQALTITNLGLYTPPPGGESAADELVFLNNVVLAGTGLSPALFGTQNIDVGGELTSINLNVFGYEYIKLKWDGMWQFYSISGALATDTFTFNSTVFNQNGKAQALSHYTFFNSVAAPGGPGTGTGVPDGGVSVMMLGFALCALEFFRRRMFA
jgi:hypothetical protein